MTRNNKRCWLVSSMMLAVPMPVLAQTAEPPSDGLDDIVVTANRTETKVQDTPISINVYSGADLADRGVHSLRDLAQIDPSVGITNSTGQAYVAVRGIASTDLTEIGDPSVPVARDGFFTNRSFSLINSSMYDVARVEVLKGPQGTLQGRNSTGGLISIVTNRPEFTNSGYGSLEYANFNTTNGELAGNLALGDNVALRASGTFLKHDGYRKLTGPVGEADDENFVSGRIQLRVRSGDFEAWASYQHDSRDVNGDAQLKTPLAGGLPDLGNLPAFTSQAPTSTTLEGDRVRWEFAYNGLGAMNLVYSGGYDVQSWRNQIDATADSYPANRNFIQSEHPRTWNHEVRISNDKSSPLFFQAGFFHFEEKNAIRTGLFNREMTGDFGPGGALAGQPNADQSTTYGLIFDYSIKTRSDAVFGQVEYDLNEQLQVALGARYTWDRKERIGNSTLLLPALVFPLCGNGFPAPGTCPPFPLVNPGNGKLDDGQPTWHVGLNYRPSPGRLIFAKYDRGYKSGGFNSNGSGPSVPYGPEQLDSFEIGTKNSLMGNTLQINASAFYFDYRGYQASQSTGVLSGGSGTFNVGKAKIFGIEGEAVVLVRQETKLHINATYLETKFLGNITVRDGAGASANIGGNQLPNAPHFSASVGIEQGFDTGDGKFTLRADGKYSSSFYYSAFNDADTRSPSYFLANASLAFAPNEGPWEIQAYVRNIFDKDVLAFAQLNYVGGSNVYHFQPPRTYGVRASVKF